MDFAIRRFNVLLYEPESASPGVKIAGAVLDDLAARTNSMIGNQILPKCVELGLLPAGASLDDLVSASADFNGKANGLSLPPEARFVVNTRPYDKLGRIPGVLGEFAGVYAEMAPEGVAVTFLNTAYDSPMNDFERLAELLDEFPAMRDSTWVVTTSLRQPMPKAFKACVTERRNGAPGGGGGKRLAVTEGLPCMVPIGDSIVLVAKDEATGIIHERLGYLRKWGGVKE
jgi:hypothetical protein